MNLATIEQITKIKEKTQKTENILLTSMSIKTGVEPKRAGIK